MKFSQEHLFYNITNSYFWNWKQVNKFEVNGKKIWIKFEKNLKQMWKEFVANLKWFRSKFDLNLKQMWGEFEINWKPVSELKRIYKKKS